MSDLLDAALQYLAAGLTPVPCKPREKTPLFSWKAYQERRPTPDEVIAWWTEHPDANIALLCGHGTWVLDIDGPEGEAALAASGVVLPADAPEATTGKGRHVYMAGAVLNGVGLLPKVDTRGAGGYVIAPPSVHPSGRLYVWVRPIHGPLPSAPPALLALLAKGGEKATRPQRSEEDPVLVWTAGVAEGGRDVACTRAAGKLIGLGVAPEVVEALLLPGAGLCMPPFPADQVAKCVNSIAKRNGIAPAPRLMDIAEAVRLTLAELDGTAGAVRRPAATQFSTLDTFLGGGYGAGEFVLLGALPGVGKSALALQWARRVAHTGQPVLLLSLEMTRAQAVRRFLVQESGVRASALKTGSLIDAERTMLKHAADMLSILPLTLVCGRQDIDSVEAAIASYGRGALGLVIVDYLQRVNVRGTRDPRHRVEAASSALKDVAIEYDVPIVALSSLSRPERMNRDWRPRLQSLRESGELEHDGDIIVLLHRELTSPDTEMYLAKNRDGALPPGFLPLHFDGERMTFREVGA